MDIYSTTYLNRVVQSLKRSPAFLLNTFFTMVDNSTTEDVKFDLELDGTKRRLAPVVNPLVPGPVVESRGYETRTITPAYIKDKRVHDVNRPFKREIGEQIGGNQNMTPAMRRELQLRRDLRDQVDMLTRRMEVWAVELLRTGQITLNIKQPDGTEKQVVVDFGRHSDLTINLTSGSYWGESGVKPLTDIEDWSLDVLQKSGSSVRNIVMDVKAWQTFRETSDLDKRLDLRRVKSGEINLGLVPDHVQYKGTDGNYDYWVYADWYLPDGESDEANEAAMLPPGTVMGIGDIEGVRHFGAIKDEEAGFQSLEYFSKSWLEKDPSLRLLLLQSAPILAPYRRNAMWSANVLEQP